jgi:hypothetical protein
VSSSPTAWGAVVHDEASMGDLSDDNINPTNLGFFAPGAGGSLRANSVLGRTENGAPDIFTFEIAAGNQLQSLTLANYELGDSAMFVAIAAGDYFPNDYNEINDPFFSDTSAWLGGRAVGELEEGQDILALIGNSAVTQIGSGFIPPLGAGKYTFYMQQTGPENLYTLDFNVSAITGVPEPTSLGMCFAATAAAWAYRRRKRERVRATD